MTSSAVYDRARERMTARARAVIGHDEHASPLALGETVEVVPVDVIRGVFSGTLDGDLLDRVFDRLLTNAVQLVAGLSANERANVLMSVLTSQAQHVYFGMLLQQGLDREQRATGARAS